VTGPTVVPWSGDPGPVAGCEAGARATGVPFVHAPEGAPAVRGFLHQPATPSGDGLVLTHGAGADCRAALLVAVAQAFAARGVAVLRCDLPFRQAAPGGPPSPRGAPRDREGLRAAVHAVRGRAPGRVFLGGHSYGGRQASLLAAEDPTLVDALCLLAYPLHPPGRPDTPRTAHLPRLRTPTLFVHGTRDPFGTLAELEAARRLVPAPTRLLPIEGRAHALAGGRGDAETRQVAQATAAALLGLVTPPDAR
jgi:predicted alpha/beta-hydrolase family hydrolase